MKKNILIYRINGENNNRKYPSYNNYNSGKRLIKQSKNRKVKKTTMLILSLCLGFGAFFGINKGVDAIVNGIKNSRYYSEQRIENDKRKILEILEENKIAREQQKQRTKQEKKKFEYLQEYQRIANYFISNLGTIEVVELTQEDFLRRFPILQDKYQKILLSYEEKFGRPGLRTLICLLNFYENSGRFKPWDNPFGTTPGGKNLRFKTLDDAIEYALSKKVLNGGDSNMLNILNTKGEITLNELAELIDNYNPPQKYKKEMLQTFKMIREGYFFAIK